MGNNLSKLCSGVPVREFRRIQCLYTRPPDRASSSDEVHICCHKDTVEQFLGEIKAASVKFNLEMGKEPEIKPEDPLEGGATRPLAEKPGAAEVGAALLVGAEVAAPGGEATEKLGPCGDAMVAYELSGVTLAGTDAQPSELDLHVVEKSFLDSPERAKRSAGKNRSPSTPELQFSMLSLDSQTSPPIGAAESLNTGDVPHPDEDSFSAEGWKAPREVGHELAMENVLGAAEEPAAGQMQLEEAFSEEALEEGGEAPADLGSAPTPDECSDAKTELGTKELTEILLSLGNDLPQAVSEPPSAPSEAGEKVPEGSCEMETGGTQVEVLPKRAQRGMLAVVDSEDKTEQASAAKIFRTSESHGRFIRTLCTKTKGDDVLLLSNTVDLISLQSDGASPAPEAMQGNEHQTSVVQKMKTRPPADVAKVTFSPKTSLEAAATGQGGSQFCSAEPIAQVSRKEDNYASAQQSPMPVDVSGPPLEGGSSGQRC